MIGIVAKGVLVVSIAAAMLPWPRLAEQWREEQWSRAYLRHTLSPARPAAPLPDPPPAFARGAVWLSRSAVEAGDPAKALALARPLAVAGDTFALAATGEALAAQGDAPGAIHAWRQAGASVRLKVFGDAAVRGARPDVAVAAYEAAYERNPPEGILIRSRVLWQEAGKPAAAEDLLRGALQRYPDASQRPSWFRFLADLLRAERRWDDAAAVFGRLSEETPGDVSVFLDLGWLEYERGGGVDAAVAQFKRGVTGSPARGEPYFAVGLFLAVAGRDAEARDWLARAEAHSDARWWYMVWGDRFRQAGDLPLALNVYRVATARHPDYAYGFYEQAWTFHLAKQPVDAVRAIERALELEGSKAAYYYYTRAGRIYESAGNRDKALASYRAALAIQPGNDEAAQGAARVAPGRSY